MITVPFVITLILSIILWIIYRLKKKEKNVNRFHEIKWLLWILYLNGIYFVTFEPFEFYVQNLNAIQLYLVPFEQIVLQFSRNSVLAWYYLLANIILMVPLGFFIPFLAKKKRGLLQTVFLGFLFSFTIEVVQAVFTFRSADIDDLIFNTFGVFIGYIFFKMVSPLLVTVKKRYLQV
ncbi:VanZ family protein [Neobacillus sp. D3-1R]|uniref:VanZ family protein n=1 Tax=Neobacillus sp. D3-1R TaxID=3445778 RepID=UPI003FA08A80